MAEVAKLDTTAAKLNPEQHFASPEMVVTEVLLTRGEKLATLDRWRDHILHELSAADEGMATRGVSNKLTAALDAIEASKAKLSVPAAN